MEMTSLADTGQAISRVGLGGCPLGGFGWGHADDAKSMQAVRRALELDVNFFDTADVYGLGHSEELLAEALGSRRRDVVIASKFGIRWDSAGRTWKDISPRYARCAVEASLRRLRLDCIPLYYIHWPDDATPLAETMAEMVRLRNEGKIRWIGLSNFTPDQIRQATSIAPVQAVQVQFSLVDRQRAEAILPLVREKKITLVTWGSLAQGLLTGKYGPDAVFETNDRRSRYENFRNEKFRMNLAVVDRLKHMAHGTGRTPATLAIRWLLDTPGVGAVLFGAKRPEQVEENTGAVPCRLSAREYRQLAMRSLHADESSGLHAPNKEAA